MLNFHNHEHCTSDPNVLYTYWPAWPVLHTFDSKLSMKVLFPLRTHFCLSWESKTTLTKDCQNILAAHFITVHSIPGLLGLENYKLISS